MGQSLKISGGLLTCWLLLAGWPDNWTSWTWWFYMQSHPTFRKVSNNEAKGPKKPPFLAETVSVTTAGSIAPDSASVYRPVVSGVETCSN